MYPRTEGEYLTKDKLGRGVPSRRLGFSPCWQRWDCSAVYGLPRPAGAVTGKQGSNLWECGGVKFAAPLSVISTVPGMW